MKVLISEKLSPHKYKTPEGYLICVDAVLARTGKQTYRRCEIFNDDSEEEIEVDRKPEEVFSEATLASFENKPVTLEHPNEDVNSGNFKDYAVGFVRDVKRGVVDGQDVILGTLVIQDEEIINEIENGEHTELSCGYDADIKDEKNPQQRNIRGNHVALCECGRAGNARIVDSKTRDAYYTIGGYAGKYDPVAMTDIKRAAKYGVNGSIERTADGWQLVLRGTPANLRNVIENYFALDPSGIEDSMKDELCNGYRIDKELNEYVVYDKHYNKEYGRYKSLEEARNCCKYDVFDSTKDSKKVIKGIIFKSKSNINVPEFRKFEIGGNGVYKLGDKYIVYSIEPSINHGNMDNDISKYDPYNEEYFSCDKNAYNLEIIGLEDIRHNGVKTEVKKFFEIHDSKTKKDEKSTYTRVTENLEKNLDKFEDDDYKFKVVNKYGRVIYSFKTREEAEYMISSLTKNGEYGYHIKDNIKDYAPPYAVWVKKNGKWIIYGGSNSQNVDRNEYIKAGYEDVKVVKNGESVQDAKQVSEEEIKEYMKKTGFSYPDAKRALEEEDSDFVEKMRHHQYDEIKDDTFKYEISWKDTYSQIKYDDIFKGTSVKDVLEQLAKTVAMRGIGTANTYVNSIHRFNKDGSTSYYPRAYGKLNSMLGQTYDSCKARDSKISKIINLYKIAKKLR